MKRVLVSLIVSLIVCLGSPRLLFAQEEGDHAAATLDDLAGGALADLMKGDVPSAHLKLAELRTLSLRSGYEASPGLSLQLLEQAELSSKARDIDKASFLTQAAVRLSPNDPRILFAAASMRNVVGTGTAAGYFFSGLRSSLKYPVVVGKMTGNALLVALSAATLSLLVLCVVQFAVRGKTMVTWVERQLSFRYRNLRGPISIVLLAAPLALGLLPALFVWSLLLFQVNRQLNKLPVCVALLWGAWAGLLPMSHAHLQGLRAPLAVELENLTTGSVPSTKVAVSAGASTSLTVRFAAAQQSAMRGDLKAAASGFETIVHEARRESSLAVGAQINLAAIDYLERRYEAGAKHLEEAEAIKGVTAEIAYNRALIQLALLDTEGHAKYYAQLQKLDREKFELYQTPEQAPRVMWSRLPTGTMYDWVFWQQTSTFSPDARFAADNVMSSLQRGGSVATGRAGACASLLIALVLPMVSRRRMLQAQEIEPPSRSIWSYVPFGAMLTAESPTAGAACLCVVFACIITALDSPIHQSSITSFERGFGPLFITASVLLSLACWVGPLRARVIRSRGER